MTNPSFVLREQPWAAAVRDPADRPRTDADDDVRGLLDVAAAAAHWFHHDELPAGSGTFGPGRGTANADEARLLKHERWNTLHTLIGLLELGKSGCETRGRPGPGPGEERDAIAQVVERIREPLVRALLVGKTIVARERGVRLWVTDASEFRGRDGGAGELVTVIGNLVDNALDAVHDRSVQGASVDGRATRGPSAYGHSVPEPRVHSVPEPRVEVELFDTAEGVLLHVADNGPGIPVERREWVFTDGASTKHRTSDDRSSEEQDRRGLGLCLVRRIAERAGGSAVVTERDGGGARFTVRLPMAPVESGRARP